MNDEKKPAHKAGPTWKTVYSTSSFDEADTRRNELLHGWKTEGTEGMQIKVKWLPGRNQYTVRTRPDPTIVVDKVSKQKKEKKGEKKGRRDKGDKKGRRSAAKREQKD